MSLDAMRASRSKPQVALIDYTTVRGKNPGRLICVFEGLEDLPYYETIFNRLGGVTDFAPVIARGKDQVLGLRKILHKNSIKDNRVVFFVDNDFDGLKGHQAGEDIYVTDGYSIENHLANTAILSSLLYSEFKCCSDGDHEAVEKINNLFKEFLEVFFEIMRPVNKAIYYARIHGVRLNNIESGVGEYFLLTLDSVKIRDVDYYDLIGWPADRDRDVSSIDEQFSKMDPHMEWRGKFMFELFVKFLNQIKIDRTSDSPRFFSKKTGVKFDPNGEIIRSLASLSSIPSSLSVFIGSFQS